MGTISASGEAHPVSAGNTVVSEMNDRSATIASTGPPVTSGVSSRALVGSKRPGQLAVADVDGDHFTGPAIQQDFGESAGRGACVQAASTLQTDTEGV